MGTSHWLSQIVLRWSRADVLGDLCSIKAVELCFTLNHILWSVGEHRLKVVSTRTWSESVEGGGPIF